MAVAATHVTMAEAKAKLAELVRRAELGEEISLTKHGKTVARLVPPALAADLPRVGALKGRIWMADDFDALGPEWDDYAA